MAGAGGRGAADAIDAELGRQFLPVLQVCHRDASRPGRESQSEEKAARHRRNGAATRGGYRADAANGPVKMAFFLCKPRAGPGERGRSPAFSAMSKVLALPLE